MEPNTQTPPSDTSQEPAVPAAEDIDALEQPEPTGPDATPSLTVDATNGNAAPVAPSVKKKGGLRAFMARFNIYLLMFLLVILVGGGIIMVAYFQSKKTTVTTIKSQNLTQSTLNQLANTDASVGDPKQVLNIESNAVFAGQALIRQGLEVAGNLQIAGLTNLQNVSIAGQTSLAQATISKDLSVSGNTAVQGQATIGQTLQVNGTGTFNGALSAPQITTPSLQLNGDLTLQHHLIAGGPIPNHSSGAALGSGGSASLSGSDTSGSVSINTGGSPQAGCFITINFTTPFNATPHVLVTPIGPSAGGLAYYVTRSTNSFSICDATAAPAGTSFGFDYFAVD